MAENLAKLPVKGILKNSTSFEGAEGKRCPKSGTHFDEMNIMATHHPPDKDYGHMKIEEPKTPFSYSRAESGDEADGVDAAILAERITAASDVPRAMASSDEETSDEEENLNETPEERAKRKDFEKKRSAHYNEFNAVKLARELLAEDDEDDETETNGGAEAMDQRMDTETDERPDTATSPMDD